MHFYSAFTIGFVCFMVVPSAYSYAHVSDGVSSGHEFELHSNLEGERMAEHLAQAQTGPSDQHHDTYSQLTRNIPSTPIISSCAAFIDYFGEVSANFTRCVISFARPLRVCEHCVEEYLRAKSAFELVMTGKHKDKHDVGCDDLILNSDRIQIIVRAWSFSKMLWDDCSCKNCFQFAESKNYTISYQLSNDTIAFKELAKKTLDCFANNSLIVASGNGTVNTSLVCSECADFYRALNALYADIIEHSHHQVCMDIVDTINTTRLEWSQQYGCNLKQIDPSPVFIISGLFCLLPIGFYLGNCIYVTRQQNDVIKHKSGGQQPPLEETTDNNDSS